eukprot:CAMPEP_0204367778 /NCGR_PEP_ID=MMETSP0469-20131031/43697_1 /ASSEMBLY_ACC=CAM_ASM_000384 /TAXON_ID=2969 /ORGANISM="Oxyrrhis marina" /LENGTH=78 /DNA_ID=CAMNT_0051357241 /DNA_START=44 /DNA_END=277 /DNA_ORIENTATION=-
MTPSPALFFLLFSRAELWPVKAGDWRFCFFHLPAAVLSGAAALARCAPRGSGAWGPRDTSRCFRCAVRLALQQGYSVP